MEEDVFVYIYLARLCSSCAHVHPERGGHKKGQRKKGGASNACHAGCHGESSFLVKQQHLPRPALHHQTPKKLLSCFQYIYQSFFGFSCWFP